MKLLNLKQSWKSNVENKKTTWLRDTKISWVQLVVEKINLYSYNSYLPMVSLLLPVSSQTNPFPR